MDDAFARLPGTPDYAPGWNRTVVTTPVAVGLSLAFALGLLAVPLADLLMGAWQDPWRAVIGGWQQVEEALVEDRPWFNRAVDANRAALAGIKHFETTLEDSSQVIGKIRPATLDGLLRFGAAGSEEAYIGKNGWLFYRPDIDALLKPADSLNDAAEGVATFAADLAERGLRLIFVPVPGKAAIQPEEIAPGNFTEPLRPEGWSRFAAQVDSAWRKLAVARGLEANNAPVVFDPAALLWQQKTDSGQAQFLRADSHWTPSAMEAVAKELAAATLGILGGGPPAAPESAQLLHIDGIGDTARMLDLPAGSFFLRPQGVEVARISGQPWSPDSNSPVILLGDSYTNIYSAEDLGWGSSAGLAEQLSRRLGFSVDRLSRNDSGALAARQIMVAAAAKGGDWLKSKKVVVWELAVREVIGGDWQPVSWEAPVHGKSSFLAVPAGQPIEITATIQSIASIPRPGDTPYADYLTAVHLKDLRDVSGGKELDAQALAYVFTMRDHHLLPAANLVAGQRVRAKLLSYGENATRLDQLNRSELDDPDLMLEEPNFAEWISPAAP